MVKGLVRILSFAAKELAEVRRQPRLIASLILGPFLILLLFGVGYNSTQPPLRTALVIPPGSNLPKDKGEMLRLFGYEQGLPPPFVLSEIVDSEEAATARLDSNALDVAFVLPANPVETIESGRSAQLRLLYNEIDPVQGGWIPYFGNVLGAELNRRIIERTVAGLKEQSGDVAAHRSEVDAQVDNLEAAVESGDPEATVDSAGQAEVALTAMEQAVLATAGVLSGTGETLQTGEAQDLRERLESGRANAAEIRRRSEEGETDPTTQRELVARLRSDVDASMPVAERISRIPPEVLASPLTIESTNRANVPNFVAFYVPGALALLLQHLALTLSSLSIVRERLLGALEIFRVAPVGKFEIFTGKYLGYTAITLLVGLILTLLLTLILGVPIHGSYLMFGLVTAELVLASLSIGFLISTLSKSESQAVQLSMIVLLASIFFSGFFLPLETLLPYVQSVSFSLPVTYGLMTLQDVMLRGRNPEPWLLLAPIGISVVALFLASRVLKRELARR